MTKAPLSFILARIIIALSILVGLYSFMTIELSSLQGLAYLAIVGFLGFTLFCLFSDRNLGRLLSVAVFVFSGLSAALAAVAGSAAGLPVYLLVVDIFVATVHLTLAWHLLMGAPARRYALQEGANAHG